MTDRLIILLFAANPLGDLKLDEEIRSIEEGIHKAQYRDLASLIPAMAPRPNDLIDKISRYDPIVVHFSGHGTGGQEHNPGARDFVVGTEGAEGQILLVDSDGAPRR